MVAQMLIQAGLWPYFAVEESGNSYIISLFLQKCEAETHELKFFIALPEQLVAWRRVVGASKIATYFCN